MKRNWTLDELINTRQFRSLPCYIFISDFHNLFDHKRKTYLFHDRFIPKLEKFSDVAPHSPNRSHIPELARYYTITPEEKSVIHQQRGASNRLGYAVQICYLRFPGRPLASTESVPESILHYISKQIGISPDSLKNYAGSRGGETRREHLRKIRNQFGYRTFTSKEYRELAHWGRTSNQTTNPNLTNKWK
ncbi:protein of unknown function [Seinonella peptonophila]|uniref:DUF4158 domain-containing protein n=1 Tax=Seinonella peptonophila TaxID=112248 RepID=A0A1M4T8J4_9BACL|nr:protein of unknown function [Seinonella peptonophila]